MTGNKSPSTSYFDHDLALLISLLLHARTIVKTSSCNAKCRYSTKKGHMPPAILLHTHTRLQEDTSTVSKRLVQEGQAKTVQQTANLAQHATTTLPTRKRELNGRTGAASRHTAICFKIAVITTSVYGETDRGQSPTGGKPSTLKTKTKKKKRCTYAPSRPNASQPSSWLAIYSHNFVPSFRPGRHAGPTPSTSATRFRTGLRGVPSPRTREDPSPGPSNSCTPPPG